MITGTNPDGTDAQVTDVSDENTIKAARYVKIFNKYIPIVYEPGQHGTGDAVTVNKTYGEDFGLAGAKFTRNDGYRQVGWALSDGGDQAYGLDEVYSGNEPLTLYPVWFDELSPNISGIENGKTYCSAVEFTVSDNDGVASVTVNGTALQAENGKYKLAPAQGEQTVKVTDRAGNGTTFVVTVNDGHTGGTATCSAKAKCSVCGAEYGELDDKNHSNLKHVEAKAATTSAEGNIEYWYCAGCGKYYKDAAARQEITQADTVTAKLPSGGGSSSYRPAVETSARTADDSHAALWYAAMVTAALGAAAVVRRKKAE